MNNERIQPIACLLTLIIVSSLVSIDSYSHAQQNQSAPNPCITIEDNGTSVAGPSPSLNTIHPISNETSRGFSNVTDVETATGSNKEIFANNTDIDSDITTGQGMEKSQLGNAIPGQQGTILEGGIMNNLTSGC